MKTKSQPPTFVLRWTLALTVLLFVSLACTLPSMLSSVLQEDAVPTATATLAPPTATPEPLPPDLIEVQPQPGTRLPMDGTLKLYFNQPMDQASVEAALQVLVILDADQSQPLSGKITWLDQASLQFNPNSPLQPSSTLIWELGADARAANGLPLAAPLYLEFQTAPPLEITQMLPEAGLSNLSPESAVVISFNQPMVSLGADPADLPVGLTLSPSAEGHGAWVNTSTYIFYPDPPLAGGMTYSVQVNTQLSSTMGVMLNTAPSWTFGTANPRVVGTLPESYAVVDLDADFEIIFSQPMDRASVEQHFALAAYNNHPVQGTFIWSDDNKSLTFTPDELLTRAATYRLILGADTLAYGGTTLENELLIPLSTVPPLAVVSHNWNTTSYGSTPGQGSLTFNGPALDEDPEPYITIFPEVENASFNWYSWNNELNIRGDFKPLTRYQISVAPGLPDPWGGSSDALYSFEFTTSALRSGIHIGRDDIMVVGSDDTLAAKVTNVAQAQASLGEVPLDYFMVIMRGTFFDFEEYIPESVQTWHLNLGLSGDQFYDLDLSLTPDETPRSPGIYRLEYDLTPTTILPEIDNAVSRRGPYAIIVSDVNLVFKIAHDKLFVWALSMKTGLPVINADISIYDKNGQPVAQGKTDQSGIFQINAVLEQSFYDPYYAVLEEPGHQHFALTRSTWDYRISPYSFGISSDYSKPELESYIYTDRPIYRPGQDVSYRVITRYAENGRYQIDTSLETVLITIYDGKHNTLFEGEHPLSSFGTSHGVYTLADDAQPGRYQITSPYGVLSFDVVEYRKPEINLQIKAGTRNGALLAGSTEIIEVDARYFFDAPGSNLDLRWNLYRDEDSFRIPGYRVGPQNFCWYCGWYEWDYFGDLIESGEGRTDASGKLSIEIEIPPEDATARYTLEATIIDESDFPVSARTILNVHPEKYYIGAKSDTWLGQSGKELGFDLLTVDWDLQPVEAAGLRAQFRQVTWIEDEDEGYIPQYETISSTDFSTGVDGVARLAFTPPSPGTYQLDIQSGNAHTQMTVWVRGAGQAAWPQLPSHQMRITADQNAYHPGDTAAIFIPNTYGAGAQALVTVERGTLMRNFVVSIDDDGYTFSLPLTLEDAPNVYLSVTLIGHDESGAVDFQQGYINIPVAPDDFELDVEVIAVHEGIDVSCPAGTLCPEHLGPQQEVTFDLRVTDAAGIPIQGEFSLTVADLAALSLTDPNSKDIMAAYYDPQPLGIRTGVALILYQPDPVIIDFPWAGMGGGGGGDLAPPTIRENFPDTAYWNAEIVTDTNGEAEVTFTLPDSLTTWHVDMRGLTEDTRVGQAETHIVTSKELLIRPVTPRFMVTGDHLEIGAIVHNNTDLDLSGEIALQAAGFILDESAEELQNFNLPAGGRSEFSWWGRVDESDQVVLVFSASGADESGTINYEDITRPVWGDIPVLHYTARQTFGTAGLLTEGDQRLELVSLPRDFDAAAGELKIELAPSLAAAMTAGLDLLEHYPYECTEQTVSRFLPNLEAYRAIQSLGLDAPDLAARLERTLDDGLVRLLIRQNRDGGWGWWQDSESDPYISAYVLFGLSRAQAAGVFVDDQAAMEDAVSYLLATLPAPEMLTAGWQLDRLAFEHFVLSQVGSGSLSGADGLYALRDQLSPWAGALLALTFEKLIPGDDRIDTLVSDLQSTALRSAAGTHWEGRDSWRNMETDTFNSALVIYALAQLDPASGSLPEAVRYLMAHRAANGAWASTYETAWTLLSLTEFMKGTGELTGDFAFSAELNHSTIAEGQAGGDARLTAVTSSVPVSVLYPDYPNALNIQRGSGPGRLYYTAYLDVLRPVEDAASLNAGLGVSRRYCQLGVDDENGCASISGAAVGKLVTARLTLTLDQAAYYLMVEDYIPAGAEILNTSLKTSQQGAVDFDIRDPFGDGWGWWFFNQPQIYDDHIAWAVDYLPSGTYELTYTLALTQPGEYRVIPAHAWQFYFPEVQGNSAGAIFEISE